MQKFCFLALALSFSGLFAQPLYSQKVIYSIKPQDESTLLLPYKEFYRFQAPSISESQIPLPEPASEVTISQTINEKWLVSQGLIKLQSATVADWFPTDEPGLVSLTFERDVNGVLAEQAGLTLLRPVLFNPNGDGMLQVFVVGLYPNEKAGDAPAPVLRNVEAYKAPTEFYPLNNETRSLKITETKTLAELSPAPMPGDEERFISITPEAIRFVKALEQSLKGKGANLNSIKILRGYISPQERLRMERLGIQLAEFTRFQYGDAFALILDANDDFRFDDLNGDGKSDAADVEVFSESIRSLMSDHQLQGGIGICAKFEGPDHLGTPYLHVDLRGWNLNWRED